MDVLINNLPNDDISVNKNREGNSSTSIQPTKGSIYRNHTHAVTNTSITNQANNLKDLSSEHKGTI